MMIMKICGIFYMILIFCREMICGANEPMESTKKVQLRSDFMVLCDDVRGAKVRKNLAKSIIL